jgi:hypothetical protein
MTIPSAVGAALAHLDSPAGQLKLNLVQPAFLDRLFRTTLAENKSAISRMAISPAGTVEM